MSYFSPTAKIGLLKVLGSVFKNKLTEFGETLLITDSYLITFLKFT